MELRLIALPPELFATAAAGLQGDVEALNLDLLDKAVGVWCRSVGLIDYSAIVRSGGSLHFISSSKLTRDVTINTDTWRCCFLASHSKCRSIAVSLGRVLDLMSATNDCSSMLPDFDCSDFWRWRAIDVNTRFRRRDYIGLGGRTSSERAGVTDCGRIAISCIYYCLFGWSPLHWQCHRLVDTLRSNRQFQSIKYQWVRYLCCWWHYHWF